MQNSKIKTLNLFSKVLNKTMAVSAYLPNDNFFSLPVLYFLHGRTGDNTMLINLNMQTVSDSLINTNQIKPMIIVCPNLENSRGLNSSLIAKEVKDIFGRTLNLGMYEDYFIKELIPFIDKNFNTIKDKTGRFIGGVSAGGYIALHTAFRHKEIFSKIGGHMPALDLALEEEDKPYFSNLATWDKYDPLHLVETVNLPSYFKIYLDAGDKDEGEFFNGCATLQEKLEKRNILSQNHIFSGNHNLEYIKSNLEKYLEFYSS